MSLKLKFFLGFLIALSAFLVGRVFLITGSGLKQTVKNSADIYQAVSSQNQKDQTVQNPDMIDTDHDGVPDREEIIFGTDPLKADTDGDGYIDGVEITTGTNPLDPNDYPGHTTSTAKPNEKRPLSANFTDRITELAMASLVDDGGNFSRDVDINGKFADIVKSVSLDAALYFAPTALNDSDIKIGVDDSKEAIKRYVDSAGPILESGILNAQNKIIAGASSFGGISPDDYSEYQKTYEALKVIEVPPSWKEIHKRGLAILAGLSKAFGSLSTEIIDSDPVKASVALNQAQSLILSINALLGEASQLAKTQGIVTQDAIIQAIQSAQSGTR